MKRRVLSRVRDRMVGVLASRHVAGRDVADALNVCRWADREGYRTIISPWGGTDDHPSKMYERYVEAIEAVHAEDFKSYVSIKLDALGFDESLFDDLVDHAKFRGVRLHIDSLGPETADKAMVFLERAVTAHHYIGYTLASRWRRCVKDAERIVELGVPVRIVKGQWSDPGAPDLDCRKNYLAIAGVLAGRCRRVGVATHEVQLAKEALSLLSTAGTRCEFEQFFSLPLNGSEVARDSGYPYRIYVAYGRPGIPYNVRFAIARPSIAAWVLADFAFRRHRPWTSNETRP